MSGSSVGWSARGVKDFAARLCGENKIREFRFLREGKFEESVSSRRSIEEVFLYSPRVCWPFNSRKECSIAGPMVSGFPTKFPLMPGFAK